MYQVLAVKCGAVDDSTKKKRRTSEHFIFIRFIHQALPFKGMFLWLATSCCMYAVDAFGSVEFSGISRPEPEPSSAGTCRRRGGPPQ